MSSKKNLLIIAVVVVLLVVIAVLFRSKPVQNNNQNNAEQPVITKTEVPSTDLPTKFPSDIPIEEGAKVLDNYNAQTPDGRFQATRTFETNKTLAANLKLYSDYLKQEDWTVQAVVDQAAYKMVVGMKDKQQLQISIDENSSSKVKTVTISLTETK